MLRHSLKCSSSLCPLELSPFHQLDPRFKEALSYTRGNCTTQTLTRPCVQSLIQTCLLESLLPSRPANCQEAYRVTLLRTEWSSLETYCPSHKSTHRPGICRAAMESLCGGGESDEDVDTVSSTVTKSSTQCSLAKFMGQVLFVGENYRLSPDSPVLKDILSGGNPLSQFA